MYKDKGITITSLPIYVIAMLLVIAIIATITSFFYTNVNNLDNQSKNISEITKFNMYFIEEVKRNKNEVLDISENNHVIVFSTGNTYTFQQEDKSIYLNNIRICENIANAEFTINEDKNIISVLITTGNNLEYSKTTNYVLSSKM